MRTIFSIALIMLGIYSAQAQTFKPFKVDLSTGYAIPQGSGSKGGLLFVVEPKYAVMDQLAVGLRLEGALTANVTEIDGEEFTGDVKATSSYLATGDYYFTNNTFRPFVGTGLGMYRVAGVSVKDYDAYTDTDLPVDYSSKFGFLLRGGFEASHFRAGLEYNIVGDKKSYLGIKVGVCIGGGRL